MRCRHRDYNDELDCNRPRVPGNADNWCHFHLYGVELPESKFSYQQLAEAIGSLDMLPAARDQLAVELSEAFMERDRQFDPHQFQLLAKQQGAKTA